MYRFYDVTMKSHLYVTDLYALIKSFVLFIPQLFCLGVLISASIALSAINEVEDSLNAAGLEYEDVGSYRGAAGWLVSVASGAILFHIVSIIIRIFYLTSYIEKHHGLYGAIVSAHEYIMIP